MGKIYFDDNRRLILKSLILVPSVVTCPRLALAAIDPVSITIITTVIQAIGQILASRFAAEASLAQPELSRTDQAFLQDFRRSHDFRMDKFQAGDMPVNQEIACTRQGSPDSALIEENLDKFGTDFALKNGRLNVQRQTFSGALSLAETGVLSAGMVQGKTMPVPVSAYSAPSRTEHSRVRDNLNLNRDDAVFALRRYSSARNPTAGGWDIATVLFANNTNRQVGSKVILRDSLMA